MPFYFNPETRTLEKQAANNIVRIGKLNRKMGILNGNEFIYCIPDFLKINNRKELEPLLKEYLQKETISIKTIMDFESNCNRK